MALLEDQLADAKEAFKNAHEAKNKEAAQVLAQRVFELETQVSELKKSEEEGATSTTGWKSPAAAGGVGAVIGAATNPLRGAVHDVITPTSAPKAAPATTGPAAGTFGGQDWTKSLTGVDVPGAQMNKQSLDIGQRMAQTVGRGGELAGGAITPGGIMVGPELGAKPPVAPTLTTSQKVAEKGKNLLQGFVADHQPTRPMDIVKGGTRGALTGAALADVPQQVSQGHYGTAVSDVGLAGGNILHGLSRTPKGKALGALLGLGSGVARAYQGIDELMPQEQKADGGAVHMAGGGALANAFTQTAVNAPFIAPTGVGIAKNVARGAYAPAIEDAAGLALAMAPLNPVTAAMSLMVPGEAGAGSTVDEWNARKAAERDAMERAQRQYEHEQFMHHKVGANAPRFLEEYQAKRNKYAPGGSVLKKLHEVLTPHEGKTLLATLADRTKATEGFQGGPGFINLHPDYTWAVDAPNVAKKHMEAVERFGGPEKTLMAPMLMSREAHKSNRPVFEKIYGDVSNKIKTGELTPEQIDAINQRIMLEKKADLSKNPGIESPDFLEFANAFNRRGALADIFGLKKLGAADLQKHLDETIDPALKEAATGAIGPQLFTMSGYEHAPGLHGGYDIGFRGEKGVDQFIPAEREFVFRDLEKQALEQMGRPMTDYNYRNILKEHGGIPNQFIDEKLLRGLQEIGHKKGGLIAVKKKKK